MKKLTVTFLVLLVTLVRLEADDVLQNGDFSDGISHWDGNGHAPSEYAPETPVDPPSPYGTVGMIIPLKDNEWTKVVQEFHTKFSTLFLQITYKFTSDLAFSQTDDDYKNVSHQIGFDGWVPFNTKPQTWMAMISDFDKERIFPFTVTPKLGTTEEQSFRGKVESLVPEDAKTICLAFPPGKGAVIILHVSLTDQSP